MTLKRWLAEAWYNDSLLVKLLLPLSWLFAWLSAGRSQRLLRKTTPADVPVIVVGNITAGGTGKTPVCLALARHFTEQGRKVVLISRGYGGKAEVYPLQVIREGDPALAGDEAVLLARQSGCAVVVDPQRARAAQFAAQHLHADLIISDDGLQHYALARTVEMAVVDGQRGLGNGLLLPAGPLREPPRRLQTVDYVIINGPLRKALPAPIKQQIQVQLQSGDLVNLVNGDRMKPVQWQQRNAGRVHAVAGIGNPARFFTSLQQLGFVIMPHAFDDHHAYVPADLAFAGEAAVIMTTKDAVKCQAFARGNWWALETSAHLPADFLADIGSRLGDFAKN